jgi:hypothetical protein
LVFGAQERLLELGYRLPRDGEFSFQTQEAVGAWQEQMGLPVTGALTPENLEQLWQAAGKSLSFGWGEQLAESGFPEASLEVSLKSYRLFLYNQTRLVKAFPVSVGKTSTPTPVGRFRILELWETRRCSLGSRWLSFTPYRHSIHGLLPDQKPGFANTLGCIQLALADLEELTPYLQVGTPLFISQKERLPQNVESQWLFYYPKKGESIEEICLRYRVGISQLLAANNLCRREELAACGKLRIPIR